MSLCEEWPADEQADDALAEPMDVDDVVVVASELADGGKVRGQTQRDRQSFNGPLPGGAQLGQGDLVDIMARLTQETRLDSCYAGDIVDQSDSRHGVI
jgi:hypothetical protein